MNFIHVTDDEGNDQALNAAFILSVKPRPRTSLGSVIRFSNGNSMNVIDSMLTIMRAITGETLCNPTATAE